MNPAWNSWEGTHQPKQAQRQIQSNKPQHHFPISTRGNSIGQTQL